MPTRWWATIADRKKKAAASFSEWKAFAVFSGMAFQLVANMLVFGYIGHLLAVHMHRPWLTALGVVVGLGTGVYGMAYLVKKLLGDKS
ncbi:MAG: AtpZ/AtpI family protein [Firmicutes bacterium]|nr:AtpZ/AtpI family protein [Bacillota bacterium]